MKDFVAQCVRTESKPDEEMLRRLTQHVRGVHAYTGMLTEIGELADQFKKHIFYGKPLDLVNIMEEGADSLWYLALLCDEYGMDIEEMMAGVIAKLRKRYPDKFTQYDALNRNTAAELSALQSASRPAGDDSLEGTTPAIDVSLLDGGD